MGISALVPSFVTFLQSAAKREVKRNEDILNGTISTEAEWRKRYEDDSNHQFEILTDEYRNLASKKNKTPEEIKKMQDMYREGFLKFGGEFVSYIDQEFGNGDGILKKDEYVNYETRTLGSHSYDKETDPNIDAANIFAHMDYDKNGNVDAKEMAATLPMFDMDVTNGGINGKIRVYDFNANALNLIKPSSEPNGKAMDEKVGMMYNFLFSSNN